MFWLSMELLPSNFYAASVIFLLVFMVCLRIFDTSTILTLLNGLDIFCI